MVGTSAVNNSIIDCQMANIIIVNNNTRYIIVILIVKLILLIRPTTNVRPLVLLLAVKIRPRSLRALFSFSCVNETRTARAHALPLVGVVV